MKGSTAAVLCDVNGTLFRLDALGDRMVEVGLPKDKLPVRPSIIFTQSYFLDIIMLTMVIF